MDSRIQWDQNPTQTRIKTTKSISGRCQGQVLGDYDNINTIYAKDRAHYAKEKTQNILVMWVFWFVNVWLIIPLNLY